MKLIAFVLLGSILFACNTHNNDKDTRIQSDPYDLAIATLQEHPGKKLMENNCYACHNPKNSEAEMMAPPMIAVKMRYTSGNISKEDFINALLEWSKNPSEYKSKMPGAVNKFEVMPYQFFPEDTIRQIADYIFDNEIEEPVWFAEHYNQMHGDRPSMNGKMGQGKRNGMGGETRQ